ncbi:MAG: serine/threonine-protein kinase [Planctomycetota bacterium]
MARTVANDTLSEPNLYVGLLAIRNEFINISELKHCLDVRRKIHTKSKQALPLGEVLVQQRYLTPQDLEYLRMIEQAEPGHQPTLADIEAEVDKQIAELKPGVQFAHYKILGELGRGGMGIVLRAVDVEREDMPVALKILIGGNSATVRDIERFKKEATVMAPLLHPGIVKILEVGRHKGMDFIAMEFVEGVSLKQLVGDKPLSGDEALFVIKSAAEAVGFMHSHGIIHRDIKPENIMVRPTGEAVLMDFGLAGWEKIEILAGRGSIGTPMYQPPEQADVGGPFGKISEASDVYGLGATLYFLITARHPFLGRSVKEVREKIKKVPPDSPRKLNPKLHAAVDALCLRCLRKRQGERFATPKELADHADKVLPLVGKEEKIEVGTRVQRRVAAAQRKQQKHSDTGKTNRPKTARTSRTGKVTKTAKAVNRRSAVGKVRSDQGRVRRGQNRGSSARRAPEEGNPGTSNTTFVVVGVAAFVVVALLIMAVVVSG